ncbi:hypothetical protein, partial [Aestuariivirga sp.]|uniref:hypothetical protein n=1 Tax=Aestuariivirga sp. TaxID=2650926 RepID=UPI0035940C54
LIAKRIGLIFRGAGEAAAMAEALPLMRKYPGSWELVLSVNNVPFSNGSIAQLLDARRDAAGDAPMPPSMAIMLMRLALTAGREDEARALARNLGDTVIDARIVLSGRLTRSSRLQGDIRETGFHVARGTEGGPAVVVFPGFKNRVGGWPIHYFDSLLASRGVTAIYAYDATQRVFFFGAEGIAGNVEGVAAHIARLPDVANASRVLTFGTSGGGMTALRTALAIGAHGCLTFGAKTILGRPAPNVPDIELERLARFTAALPLTDRDLRAAWPEDRHLQATMFYGTGYAPDKAHAARLADRPGVTLCPVDNVMDHDAFTPSLESGAFEAALDRLLGRTG